MDGCQDGWVVVPEVLEEVALRLTPDIRAEKIAIENATEMIETTRDADLDHVTGQRKGVGSVLDPRRKGRLDDLVRGLVIANGQGRVTARRGEAVLVRGGANGVIEIAIVTTVVTYGTSKTNQKTSQRMNMINTTRLVF